MTCCLLFTWRGSERVHVLVTDITFHHLIQRMHTCRNAGDTCTRFYFRLFSLPILFSLSLSLPLLSPLDGTVQLFVRCHSQQWCCASVFVSSLACLSGTTAAFWGAFECLISLSCYTSFWGWGVIFVFHSQLCSKKMALWSVSRSITDKEWLSGNFQPDQLCLSIVWLHMFWQ